MIIGEIVKFEIRPENLTNDNIISLLHLPIQHKYYIKYLLIVKGLINFIKNNKQYDNFLYRDSHILSSIENVGVKLYKESDKFHLPEFQEFKHSHNFYNVDDITTLSLFIVFFMDDIIRTYINERRY